MNDQFYFIIQVDGGNLGWLLYQRCTSGGMFFFIDIVLLQ